MLWLALHFPMLGLEERLGSFGGDASVPAVLVEDSRVVQTNGPARQAEVALGSTLATANSILPGILHFNRDPSAEHERLATLAQIAYRYTPKVSPAPPNALLLEVRGSLHLFGGLGAIGAGLATDCRRLGHAQSLAVATTPLAALMRARAGLQGVSDSTAGQPIETALNGVSLAHSDLSPKDRERLGNMGITRADQLLTLPAGELGKRFGPALIDYLARLRGHKADPRTFIEPRERFRSSIHLLEPVRGKDALLFPMRRLATELARWLARRQFGTRRLVWTVKPLTGSEIVLAVEFAQPRRDDQSFLGLSKLKLDGADLPAEVMSVSLRAEFVAPFTASFADLLGMTESNAASHGELIDLLAAKLGGGAVRNLRLVDDHRPEHAWFTGQAGRREPNRGDEGDPTLTGCSRPMWLLDPPQPVDAESFEMASGPERIETGWWGRDSHARLRDYYIAFSKHGAKCWLYREQNHWFLHGYFS